MKTKQIFSGLFVFVSILVLTFLTDIKKVNADEVIKTTITCPGSGATCFTDEQGRTFQKDKDRGGIETTETTITVKTVEP